MEQLVGEAIAGQRDVFLVSKVLPTHATRHATIAACERSLRRLGTDRLDLYPLHWRGSTPLGQTLAGYEELQRLGKIRHWGVSNFDMSDMDELLDQAGGAQVQCDQVLYNLTRLGIKYDLLPWWRRKRRRKASLSSRRWRAPREALASDPVGHQPTQLQHFHFGRTLARRAMPHALDRRLIWRRVLEQRGRVLPRVPRQLAHLIEQLALLELANVGVPRRQRAHKIVPTGSLHLADLTFGRILS